MRYTLPGRSLMISATCSAALIALWPTFASAQNSARTADGPPISGVVPLEDSGYNMLSDILSYDPLRSPPPTSPLRARSQQRSPYDLGWDRAEKSDGSSAVSAKKQLPLEWDAKVGAEFGLAGQPGTGHQPLPVVKEQNSTTAWANVTVPGVASVSARIEPGHDQHKLGTTLSRSLPLGSNYSLTLQNSFAVTESLGAPSTPVIAGGQVAAAQVWSADRLVKFNILSTGTSLAAGTSSSSTDKIMRNKIGAEQKMFGPLNVTTSVTDVGAASSNKSVTAGFKLQW